MGWKWADQLVKRLIQASIWFLPFFGEIEGHIPVLGIFDVSIFLNSGFPGPTYFWSGHPPWSGDGQLFLTGPEKMCFSGPNPQTSDLPSGFSAPGFSFWGERLRELIGCAIFFCRIEIQPTTILVFAMSVSSFLHTINVQESQSLKIYKKIDGIETAWPLGLFHCPHVAPGLRGNITGWAR